MIADMPSDSPDSFCFDDQAGGFDSRAGLPDDVSRHIAHTVLALAAPGDERILLDVGAGTGEIGTHLAGSSRRYLGVDLSGPMLRIFRSKLEGDTDAADARAWLAEANANVAWPIRSDTAALLFMSRSVHLLEPRHVATEALRVLGTGGGPIVFGRIRRAPDSLRARMRGEMRRLLGQAGIQGRNGAKGSKAAVSFLEAAGARAVAPRVVARWPVHDTPSGSLLSWSRKSGLAGVPVSDKIKDEVMSQLENWARGNFGDLEAESRSEECYEILVIQTQAETRSDTPHEK
jgi:ubiquinone/menaquinone biosynthesis C-methylase UbiE